MDTNELLTKAVEKLKETIIDFEGDKKQLAEITEERGNLLALELIESKPENRVEITKLNKTIMNLKTIISDTPVIIDGLKRAKLKLLSQKEKEEKNKALKGQIKLETFLNLTSLKLIQLLKEIVELNSKLKDEWANWDGLDKISGRGLTDKKCIRPSIGMLDLVVKTLLDEWLGQSDGEVRKFYSKDRYNDTRIIF